MILSTINLIYLIAHRPMEGRLDNFIEVFNELCIVSCSHIVDVFLNAAVPVDFRDQLGWTLMAIAGLNIMVNLILTAYVSFRDMIDGRIAAKQSASYLELVNSKLMNRRHLTEIAPKQFPQYEQQLTIDEAIVCCRQWVPQRRWMLANGLKVDDLPEEVEFQKLVKDFKLMSKARNYKLSEGISFAAQALFNE